MGRGGGIAGTGPGLRSRSWVRRSRSAASTTSTSAQS
jgi:hypothetical protein